MNALDVPLYSCLPKLESIPYPLLDDWMETYPIEFTNTRKKELLKEHFPEGNKKQYDMERVEDSLKEIISTYNEEILLQANS